MAQHIEIVVNDTEPLMIVIGARGVTDLSDLTTAVFFVREINAATNHVNGVLMATDSSVDRRLRFDPVNAKAGGGNAFDTVGSYEAYVRMTWSDGDITRHPGGSKKLTIKVVAGFE